jgi:hypothetical protein
MQIRPLAQFSSLLFTALLSYQASAFEKGQRVWIDLPAININDDAYAEGQVVQDKGEDKLSVLIKSVTTSKAFASGVSCTPDTDLGVSAEQTTSTIPDIDTQLTPNKIQILPRQQLLNWTAGYNRYYDRQNWLNIFLKWSDNHPVIERDQILVVSNIARARNMNDLAQITDLVLENYDAYQTEHFIFYPLPERLTKLIPVLQHVRKLLDASPELLQAWQPQHRSLEKLNHNSYTLFMTQALDKIVEDARKSRNMYHATATDNMVNQIDTLLNSLTRTP